MRTKKSTRAATFLSYCIALTSHQISHPLPHTFSRIDTSFETKIQILPFFGSTTRTGVTNERNLEVYIVFIEWMISICYFSLSLLKLVVEIFFFLEKTYCSVNSGWVLILADMLLQLSAVILHECAWACAVLVVFISRKLKLAWLYSNSVFSWRIVETSSQEQVHSSAVHVKI